MGTIADKMNYLLETKKGIREAIAAKGVSISDGDTFRSYADKIASIEIGGSGGDTPTPDMPVIGDGKTYLYIKIAEKGRMTVPLYFSQTITNGVTIDWGDGSTTQTLSGTGNVNTTHTYADVGEYTISLNPLSGCTLGLGIRSSSYCVMGSTENNGKVYCNMLQAVEIGNNVIRIDYFAFSNCYSLSSIVIPNSVTSIGESAFSYCFSLTSIVIPNSVTSIGESAFDNCQSLTSIVIPSSVKSIGTSAFLYCNSLSNIVISDGVTSIGNYAFQYCRSLSSIVIPNSVKSIDHSVFDNCQSLTSIVIPNSVTSIGVYAFRYCVSLSSIVIPNNVTSISNNTFYYCRSLSSIVIPESVTSIGSSAFSYCYSLSSIVIPSSVKSIGESAFMYCCGMAFYDFRMAKLVPTLEGTSVFYSIPSDCKIVVPDSLYDTWVDATNWSTYTDNIIKASEFNG